MSRPRVDDVTDEALLAVASMAHDASLRPMQSRGPWMSRLLVILTPAALYTICQELLKRRREARGQ
jgi:hypothetical protein